MNQPLTENPKQDYFSVRIRIVMMISIITKHAMNMISSPSNASSPGHMNGVI